MVSVDFRWFLIAACMAVAACAERQDATPAVPDEPAGETAAASTARDYSEFNTDATIRDLMNTLIDPHANAIWQSVRYEVDAEGMHEFLPESEEEWQALRLSALTLLEGANALMIPGRRAAPPGAVAEDPEYEYQPEEVEGRIQAGWPAWVAFARTLQSSTVQVLEAIEARDVDLVFERSGLIYGACESCHGRYWYRQ